MGTYQWKLGREAQQVGLDQLEVIAVALGFARDPERLAKIRSGKLKVDEEALSALLKEDREAMLAFHRNPFPEGLTDPHPERAHHG